MRRAESLILSGPNKPKRVRVMTKPRGMPITIYGIKNCDTMKKARAWLDKRGVD